MGPTLLIPTLSLEGRVALVTGAGSGIGAATALLFGQAGAKLALLDKNSEGLESTAGALRRHSDQFKLFQADTSSADILRTVFRDIERAWEGLDVLVANAGINGVWAPLDEITREEWDETLRVNLTGTFLTLKHALPLLPVPALAPERQEQERIAESKNRERRQNPRVYYVLYTTPVGGKAHTVASCVFL